MEAKAARESFGKKLSKLRTERNKTKEFVAESIGVSVELVTEWENGLSLPDTKSLIDITILYDLEPVGLMEKLVKQY